MLTNAPQSPRANHASLERRRQALKLMLEFTLGQKWMMTDATFGTFFAEAIEAFEDGISGIVVITDENGNRVDTFSGTAVEFHGSGEWRLLKE